MRWLSNPMVSFLAFVGSVITLGQFAIAAYRWISGQMQGEESAKRVRAATLVVGTIALAVIAPLSWTAVLTEAHKSGNEGFIGATYPIMMNGCSLNGLFLLYAGLKEGWRGWLPRSALFLLLGFGGTAMCVAFSGAPRWETYVVAGLPGVIWPLMLVIGLIALHAKRAEAPASA